MLAGRCLRWTVGAVLAVLLGACGRAPDPSLPVILIVVDALRADHLGCYGYARSTSPGLDRLAQTATVYERAMASSPWTLPTHASLFTGKDPFEHGAHKFKTDDGNLVTNPLPSQHTTLAEVLHGAGYATGAVVANDGYVTEYWQLHRGFETFDAENAKADGIEKRVLAWLDAVGEEPFFLFVNFMDTHAPYNAKPVPGLLEAPPDADDKLFQKLRQRMKSRRYDSFPVHLARKVIDQYDTAIANVDLSLGHLLDALAERGLFDRCMIVVTSDHGEGFGEHRIAGHGMDVYQNLLWVPLIVKDPNQTTARRIHDLVSSSDVPALIVSQLPEEVRKRATGTFPNVFGQHPVISESYFAGSKWAPFPDRIRQAVFDGPYKYIHSSDGRSELYQLELDPAEAHDLVEFEPEVATRLAERLEAYILERGREEDYAEPSPISPEQAERLRALGYIDP